MRRIVRNIAIISLLVCPATPLLAADDTRQMVTLPEMMQAHMLANMRDHLATLNQILAALGSDDLDQAADLAESRLGMSSLEKHGAEHLAQFMPPEMRQLGTNMHKAASRFARKAQEGESLPAYQMLTDITAACVACHAAYRIR